MTDPAVTTQLAPQVAFSVNHPKFHCADPESLRTFLNQHEQYAREVRDGAQKLSDGST